MPKPQPASPKPHVHIALCTYNGAHYLEAQLASYEAQSHRSWDLWVSDDGSTDQTRDIVHQWARKWQGRHALHLVDGPGKGPGANFLTLLCRQDFPASGFVALSDQDDVWHADKLERALGHVSVQPAQRPVLYGAQSQHVGHDLRPIGHSDRGGYIPSFQNALIQNIISGHTSMLNPAALALVRSAGVPAHVTHHDWWLYQVISGAGGVVLVDDAEVLLYRQHTANAMGAHRGLVARLQRLRQVFDGTYGGWLEANMTALQRAEAALTDENRALVKTLRASPRGPGLARLRSLRRAGLRRRGKVEQIIFDFATLLGRI